MKRSLIDHSSFFFSSFPSSSSGTTSSTYTYLIHKEPTRIQYANDTRSLFHPQDHQVNHWLICPSPHHTSSSSTNDVVNTSSYYMHHSLSHRCLSSPPSPSPSTSTYTSQSLEGAITADYGGTWNKVHDTKMVYDRKGDHDSTYGAFYPPSIELMLQAANVRIHRTWARETMGVVFPVQFPTPTPPKQTPPL